MLVIFNTHCQHYRNYSVSTAVLITFIVTRAYATATWTIASSVVMPSMVVTTTRNYFDDNKLRKLRKQGE